MGNIQLKQRNTTIDIGKGIAIILMSIGHSYCPERLDRFIPLFHMAFFFMMSGYCFSIKKVQTPKDFIWKRITGLYFPFVKWGIVFVFLHNLFSHLLLLTDPSIYSFKEMCWKAFTTIPRFIPTEEMMGPYWFLTSLFYVSLFSYFLFWISEKLKMKEYARACLFTFFYILGFILIKSHITISDHIIRTMIVSFLFYSGFLWKKYQNKIPYTIWGTTLSFIILLFGVFTKYHRIGIPDLHFENPILFLIYSFSGCYLLLSISSLLNQNYYIRHILSYIGEYTLTILLTNMLCRRVLHVLRYHFFHTESPLTPPTRDSLWWIAYTLFMIIVPLAIRYIYIHYKHNLQRYYLKNRN